MAQNSKKEYFELGASWSVSNVRRLEWGTFFTLNLGGLSLYNMRVVPAGKTYDSFVAAPQEKGKDGNWYNLYSIYLSDDDIDAVIEAVENWEEPKKNRRGK